MEDGERGEWYRSTSLHCLYVQWYIASRSGRLRSQSTPGCQTRESAGCDLNFFRSARADPHVERELDQEVTRPHRVRDEMNPPIQLHLTSTAWAYHRHSHDIPVSFFQLLNLVPYQWSAWVSGGHPCARPIAVPEMSMPFQPTHRRLFALPCCPRDQKRQSNRSSFE